MSSTGVLPAKAEEATSTPAPVRELDLRTVVEATPRLDELSVARVVGQIAALVQAAKAGGKPTELAMDAVKIKVADGSVEVAFGTFAMAYASPERAKGVSTDRKSDVFSLGILLWEALTHARLFVGGDDAAIAKAILAGDAIKSPSELNANVPAELAAICKKALAADPADRYQSPKVMAAEIDAVLDDASYPEDNSRVAAYMQKLAAAKAAPAPAKKEKELPAPKVAPKIATPATPITRPSGTNPPPSGTLPGLPPQKPATIPPPMSGKPTPEPGSVAAIGSAKSSTTPPATKPTTPEPGSIAAIGSAPAAKSSTTPPATKPTTPEPGSIAAATKSATPEPGSIAAIEPASSTKATTLDLMADDVKSTTPDGVAAKPAPAVANPTPVSSKQTLLGHAAMTDVPAAPLVPRPPTLPPPIAQLEDVSKTTPFVRDDVLAAPMIAVGQIPGLESAAPATLTKIEPAAAPAVEPPKPKPGEVPIIIEATKKSSAPPTPAATEGVHPASIVSLPRARDSKSDMGTGKHDVLSTWAWSGEAPEGFADEDFHAGDDEGRRRKLLMYGIGGGIGVVLLICIFAFGFGGLKKPAEDDKALASAPKPTEFKPTGAAGSAPTPDPAPPQHEDPPPQQEVAPPPPAPTPDAAVAAVEPPPPPPEVKKETPPPPPPPPVKQPDPPKKDPVVKKDPPAKKDPPKKTEPKKAEPKKVAAGPVDPYAEPASKVDPAEAYRKGLQQYARGDTNGALATFKSSMASNAGYAPTYRGLGLVYEKMGNHSMARAAFKRYLALAPNASDADGIRERMEKL